MWQSAFGRNVRRYSFREASAAGRLRGSELLATIPTDCGRQYWYCLATESDFHCGSNEMNVAYIMLQLRRDFGIVMMTNGGGKKADQAMIALEENLYRRFFPAH